MGKAGFAIGLLMLSGCVPPVSSGEEDAAMAGPDLAVAGGDGGGGGCSPRCAGLTPLCNATHHCVACVQDGDCAKGTYCKIVSDAAAICTPGCNADANCANGQKCCNLRCVDTATDDKNCGGCGMACAGVHATAACAAGQCQPGKCDPGWGDCNRDPNDGCEANLHADPMNCTACGAACNIRNAYNGCADGCYMTACMFGFDDCNMNPMDGCETVVRSDPKNCGSCGKSCALLPNAMAGCVNGNCVLSSCNAGYADCDQMANTGCEVQIATDAKNCGKCGNVCAQGLVCINGGCTCPNCNFAHATSVCVNNVCTLDQCNAGWGNCDNNAANGCETNLDNDAANCGKCGTVCPMNTPFCGMSVCVVAPLGCFRTTDVQQMGVVNPQYTQCEQVLDNGFTCVNPLIRYGNTPNGVPAMHVNDDFVTWCKQLGCKGYAANSVKYGARNYAAPFGKLFWCSGYDEVAVKWCDWQDGKWFNATLDYHAASADAITQITCN
jgi:hypothetical protein